MIRAITKRRVFYIYVAMVLLAIVALLLVAGLDSPWPWALLPLLVLVPILHMKFFELPYLSWKEQYSVGVEEIDSDHKQLVDLINRVVTAASTNLGDEFVGENIYELVAYAKYHLNREERLMDEYEFPGRKGHKRQHQSFIDAVARFEDEYEHDLKVKNLQMFDFLREWLLRHISYTDKELGAYIQGRRAQSGG
jgi:hemerythrin